MTYANLMADADLYFSLDGNMDYVAPQANFTTVGSTPRVFSEDAPAGLGSTQSLLLTQTTGLAGIRPRLSNLNNSGNGRTISFWYKTTKPDGSAQTFGDSLGNTIVITNSDNIDAYINIGGSTLTEARISSSGKPSSRAQVVNTSTSALTSITNTTSGAGRIIPGIWNHIAVVHLTESNIVYMGIYVNGINTAWQRTVTRTLAVDGYGIGERYIDLFETTNETVSIKKISNFALWNRALSRDEIRAQAAYGFTTTESYKSRVLQKNPVYFNSLNNATPFVEPEILGPSANWGNFHDDFQALSVNQPGYPQGTSWKLTKTSLAGGNFSTTTTPDFLEGVSALQRNGEFSFEFWIKMKPYYSSIAFEPFFMFGSSSSAVVGNGYFNIIPGSGFGRLGCAAVRKTSDTAFSAITISPADLYNNSGEVQIGPGTIVRNESGSQIGGNWADDRWHHIVFRQSITRNFNGVGAFEMYVDGKMVGSTNLNQTWGWITSTTPIANITLGTNSSNLTLPEWSMANIAFYDRALTEYEIYDNFLTATFYQEPAPSDAYDVKYYNGTSWEQSVAQKYYDGNGWVNWNNVSEPKRWDGTQWVDLS